MTSSQTTDAGQVDDVASADAAQDERPLTAPAGLDLLGDANAGGCCGGSCAVPGA